MNDYQNRGSMQLKYETVIINDEPIFKGTVTIRQNRNVDNSNWNSNSDLRVCLEWAYPGEINTYRANRLAMFANVGSKAFYKARIVKENDGDRTWGLTQWNDFCSMQNGNGRFD